MFLISLPGGESEEVMGGGGDLLNVALIEKNLEFRQRGGGGKTSRKKWSVNPING